MQAENNPCKQSQPSLTHSSYYKLMHISGVNADFSISINYCLPSYLWSVLIFLPASTIDVHLRQQKLSTRGNLHKTTNISKNQNSNDKVVVD